MSQKEFMKYLKTAEFKDILERYEKSLNEGEVGFFDADDLIDIAECYHLDNKILEAAHAIDICLERYPDDTPALLFKARLSMLYFHDLKEARLYYDKVQDKDSNPDADYVYAEILILEEKPEEADDFLEKKYQQYMEESDGLGIWGAGGDFDDDPDEEDDGLNFPLDMAVLFIDHNYADLAEKWLKRAKPMDEEQELDIWETKGRIYMQQGRMKEAEHAWNKLLDGDAYHFTAWMRLCDTQFAQGKFEEAIQSSEYAIAIAPNLEEAYLTNGNCHFQLGHFDEAAKSLQKYLTFYDDDPVALLLLATTQYCQEKPQEAYKTIKKTLKYKDELTKVGKQDAYHLAACIAAKVEDFDKAWFYCKKYTATGAHKADVEILKGILCLEEYSDNEAKEHFANALKNASGDLHYITKVALTLYDYSAWEAVYELLTPIAKMIEEEKYEYLPADFFPIIVATSKQLKKEETFRKYLKYAVKFSPEDTMRMLAEFFPENTTIQDYINMANSDEPL